MEIRGHIVQILPLQSGVSQASGREWKKQEYILETGDQYPAKGLFSAFWRSCRSVSNGDR